MPIPRNNDLQKRRTRLTSMACAILCLGFFLTRPIAAKVNQIADRLYERALEQVGRVTFGENLKAFREVLNADRDYAPAHFEIAKLYMSLDTPMDRAKHCCFTKFMKMNRAVSVEAESVLEEGKYSNDVLVTR